MKLEARLQFQHAPFGHRHLPGASAATKLVRAEMRLALPGYGGCGQASLARHGGTRAGNQAHARRAPHASRRAIRRAQPQCAQCAW
jgi:hypothetical protein